MGPEPLAGGRRGVFGRSGAGGWFGANRVPKVTK